MDRDLERIVRQELGPSEKLLWAGQPIQGIRFFSADVFLIPFSLIWAGFAVYLEWSALRSNAPPLFGLWGIPFVLVGIYIVVGRFFVDAALRARTLYALTSERIIIRRGWWRQELRSLSLRHLPEISLQDHGAGRGTLLLGSAAWPFATWFRGAAWPGISRNVPPSFDSIENARQVYELLRTAQAEASRVGA